MKGLVDEYDCDDPHRDIEAAVPVLTRLGVSCIFACGVGVALLFLVYFRRDALCSGTGVTGIGGGAGRANFFREASR